MHDAVWAPERRGRGWLNPEMRLPEQHDIVEASAGLRVFPDPADVFVADQPELAN